MLEPSMIENLGKQNFLDKFDNSVKGQPIVDQTFNEVFSSLQKTDHKNEDINNRSRHEDNEEGEQTLTHDDDDFNDIDEYESDYDRGHDDIERPIDSPHESDTATQREAENLDEPVVAEVMREANQTDDPVISKRPHANERAVLAKTANEAIQKLNQLLKEDPLALKKLFEGTSDKTFGGILKSLGLNDENLEELSKFVDLDQKVSEKTMNALKSGKPSALFNLLKNVGLDKGILDEASAALQRKLEGMKPVAQTQKETSEHETDENEGGEHKHLIKNQNKHTVKAGQSPLHASTPAKGAARQNSAVTTSKEAIDKAGLNATKAGSKEVSAPQAAKGSANNVDISITNNGSQKTEAAQASSKTQAPSRGAGFEKMLMDQIIEKVRINIRQNGRSNMTIRLDPPNLGKVDLRVVTHAHMVQAVMVVENREVKAIAEGNLDSLKASLESSGLKVDEVVVTTADEGHQFKNQNLAQEPGFGFNNGRNSNTSGGADGLGDENETENGSRRTTTHEGVLDVVA